MSQVKLDLLALKPVRAVALRSWFPVLLQLAALVAVGGLVVTGFGVGLGVNSDLLLTLRKTNLTTLVVWGLWWPGMIIAAVALGRVWCTVCPMELLNRVGEGVARRLGLPRIRLGRFLRAGWLVVISYLALQVLVAGWAIHRMPHYTAVFLLALLGAALVTGLVFRESRSFCKAFCPAGALLSVYGRTTPFQLDVRDPSNCERCSTKDCVRAKNRRRFDKRSCPSLLRPFRRNVSDGCVLCLQCAKVCPHANVGFGLVSTQARIRRKGLLRPYEAAFVMVALGFVSHEVIGEVKWLDAFFHCAPTALAKLAPALPFHGVEALWFLVLFPGVVWTLVAAVGFIGGHRAGLRSLLLAAATGAAPIVAIAHLAKAAAKISSWIGFLPLALSDPNGLHAFRRITEGTLATPASLLGLTLVGWTMLAMTVLIAWRASRWARQLPSDSVVAAKAGLGGACLLFSAVLILWGWPSG